MFQFQSNEVLLKRYYDQALQSRDTLVDFGVVPTDPAEFTHWSEAVSRFTLGLARRGFLLQPAIDDGNSVPCPLYRVRLDKQDVQDPMPVELPYFEWVVKQFCRPGQWTNVRDRVLEIDVLGDKRLQDELFGPGRSC